MPHKIYISLFPKIPGYLVPCRIVSVHPARPARARRELARYAARLAFPRLLGVRMMLSIACMLI